MGWNLRVNGWRAAILAGLALAGCQTASTPAAPAVARAAPAMTDSALATAGLASRLLAGKGMHQDTMAAAELFELSARAGDAQAATIVGQFYLSGVGVARDAAKAADWLKQGADRGDLNATTDLAYMALHGVGSAKDPGRAMLYAKQLSAAGKADGDNIQGLLYMAGEGVDKDPREARHLWRDAADKGFSPAMFNLGEIYRDGSGVAIDRVAAYAWFDLAAAKSADRESRENAVERRDELALLMLPDDMVRGRRLAAIWHPGQDVADLSLPSGDGAIAAEGPLPTVTPAMAASLQSANEPIVSTAMTDDIAVNPDGTSTMVSHMEVLATNEAAARRIGEQQLYYVESRDTVEVVEAYTQKRDGRKLPVSPSAIHEQTPPGAAEMAMFDDRRVKIVVFPDVEAGDTVVLTARYSDKPALPGHYTLHMVANRMQPQLGWRVTVTAPTAMAMQVETHDLAFEKRVYGDKTVYEWRYANPAAITDPKFGLDVSDLWPRFYLSSYKSYDEMAKDYAAEADSTTTVTPAIQAQADEITSGVSDKKRQAELIYGWVSRHIRYVAVEIGASAYIPHPAESVLTNGYGDCKDHSVLVVALLKAKHIKAQLVLINLGTSYALGVPPVFGSLNHEIAYLPDMGLYIDTTAGEAPFGTLPFAEYGKPVVHIGSEAPALRRTPILPPGAASITLRTTARLEADGRVIGDSEAESAGPFALGMRQYAVAIQQAGSEQAVKAVLRQTGKEGIGSFNFASPFDPSPSYKIDGHFEITPHPEYLAGASFALPSELEAGWRPGEELLGPLDLMDLQGAQPTACFSGHEIEERVLELPAGKRVRDLPKGLDITDKILTYHSVWSVAGHSVTWRRELTTTVDQPVCLGAVRQEAAKALNDIRGDLNSGVITLIDDAAASKG